MAKYCNEKVTVCVQLGLEKQLIIQQCTLLPAHPCHYSNVAAAVPSTLASCLHFRLAEQRFFAYVMSR